MAVFYRLLQKNDPHCVQTYGKWYARAVHPETLGTYELARIMQENCTLKRSDILATISELVDTMTRELQDGKCIRLDGLGTFKIGLESAGVDDPEDFRPDRHVRGAHVLFRPATRVAPDGRRHRALLSGTQARELPATKR